jgi:hypothetical protein
MSDWRDPSEEDLGPQEFHREPKSKNKTNKKSLSTEKSQDLKNFYFFVGIVYGNSIFLSDSKN